MLNNIKKYLEEEKIKAKINYEKWSLEYKKIK